MSARSRGRAQINQDADEERRLFKEIKDKAKALDALTARGDAIGHEIIDLEQQQADLISLGKPPSKSLDERIEQLYRDNVKLSEEYSHLCEGASNDMNLLDSLHILAVLREASEASALAVQLPAGSRAASGKLARGPKKSASKVAAPTAAVTTEEGEDAPAASSPRISVGPMGRLNLKDKSSRAGSIPATREASVKIEDGAESVASSADGTSSITGPPKPFYGNRPSNRLVLRMGEIVFCRHDLKNHDPKKNEVLEGEGILCRVTAVIGEGKQRRYEVQDADVSSDPPPPQRASVAQLVQIPETNKGLSDLPKGKQVLAQYPDTTTFYKAEVSEAWRAKDLVNDKLSVRLNFQDDESPREVERRFVLTEK